jgi:hypothetical protein
MAKDETRDADPLDEQSCLVVAALADGEPVDPDALKSALDDPAVREYLVDLITLRESVGTLSGLPPVQWREHRSVLSRVGWMAAAAAVIVSLTAGYVAGQRAVQAAPAPSVETFVDFSGSGSAPKPTRVVPLRPGVNWTEKVEGQ